MSNLPTTKVERRWYQDEAEFALFEYFNSGKTGNPVIALPTGTGKGYVISNFIKNVFSQWPSQRVMMMTHVKELIQQNADKLISVWDTAPLGIYSAGLNSRDMILPINFGGVQSVSNAIKRSIEANLPHFGWRDLIIIDECHLLSPNEDTMYQYIIRELTNINPSLRVIGLSATPYRLKQGMITDNGIFTDICYDITGVDGFTRLINEGYMCQLIPRPTKSTIDTSNIKLTAGEFNGKQMECVADKITYDAIKEDLEYADGRKSWLVFASGIKHAEHISEILQSFGIDNTFVHSKLSEKENDARIEAFKNGEFTALVNNNKLTTGFDYAPIDFIMMLRSTMSPGFWIQMAGRGTRPSPGTFKENCLLMDHGGNTERLGPINDPVMPSKRGARGGGEAPIKICPECGVYNHSSVRFCINCSFEFKFESKLSKLADTRELIRTRENEAVIEYFNVQKVIYNRHEKKSNGLTLSPPSLKVSYFCGFQMFNEWVCLEHPGMAGTKAAGWWSQRSSNPVPTTVDEALRRTNELRTPNKLRVWTNKKYPEILSAEW